MRCSLTASLSHSLSHAMESQTAKPTVDANEAEAAIFSPLFPFVVKLLYSIRRLGIKQRGREERGRERDRFLPPFPGPGSPFSAQQLCQGCSLSTKPLPGISAAPESMVACRQQVAREQMLVALHAMLSLFLSLWLLKVGDLGWRRASDADVAA